MLISGFCVFLTASHIGKGLFIQRAQTAQSGIFSYLANTHTRAKTSSLHPTDFAFLVHLYEDMGVLGQLCHITKPFFPSNLPLKLFLPSVSQPAMAYNTSKKNPKVFLISMCRFKEFIYSFCFLLPFFQFTH